jgi:hypothetical protein
MMTKKQLAYFKLWQILAITFIVLTVVLGVILAKQRFYNSVSSRFTGGEPRTNEEPLGFVAPENMRQANDQFQDVLDEINTGLLKGKVSSPFLTLNGAVGDPQNRGYNVMAFVGLSSLPMRVSWDNRDEAVAIIKNVLQKHFGEPTVTSDYFSQVNVYAADGVLACDYTIGADLAMHLEKGEDGSWAWIQIPPITCSHRDWFVPAYEVLAPYAEAYEEDVGHYKYVPFFSVSYEDVLANRRRPLSVSTNQNAATVWSVDENDKIKFVCITQDGSGCE